MTRATARNADASADVEASLAAEPAPSTDVTIKVAAPYQVSHDGKVYGSGETLSVPVDVAEPWLLAGWANTGKPK